MILELQGFMGGIYRITEWIMRLVTINILWIIFSIPFFFILLITVINPNFSAELLMSSLVILGIVSPFTIFPATTAMFSVARKWIIGQEDVPLFRTFIQGFLKSLLGGIVFVLLFVIVYVNYHFYINAKGYANLLHWVFISFGIILFPTMLNFFSLTVHYHMKLRQLLKNAILITIGRPFRSLFLIFVNAGILYLSARFTFLIPFFMGTLMAIVSFWSFYRIFLKVQDLREEEEKKALEQAELQNSVEADHSDK